MTIMKALPLLLVVYSFIGSLSQPQLSPLLRIVTPAVNNDTTCPSTDILPLLRLEVQRLLTCGDGEWTEVANIDMTNSSQSCPSPWTEVNTPSRLCTSSSCQNAAVFNVSSPYSRVCGRVLGAATAPGAGVVVHTNFHQLLENPDIS